MSHSFAPQSIRKKLKSIKTKFSLSDIQNEAKVQNGTANGIEVKSDESVNELVRVNGHSGKETNGSKEHKEHKDTKDPKKSKKSKVTFNMNGNGENNNSRQNGHTDEYLKKKAPDVQNTERNTTAKQLPEKSQEPNKVQSRKGKEKEVILNGIANGAANGMVNGITNSPSTSPKQQRASKVAESTPDPKDPKETKDPKDPKELKEQPKEPKKKEPEPDDSKRTSTIISIDTVSTFVDPKTVFRSWSANELQLQRQVIEKYNSGAKLWTKDGLIVMENKIGIRNPVVLPSFVGKGEKFEKQQGFAVPSPPPFPSC
ncbi:hypothetical protein M426DRAFT_94464 [Hypoxylon sp. CI-4A]|nr:hypothetical protein M426DRAFT_94464 [Hypoxylon sp. CI-4A]